MSKHDMFCIVFSEEEHDLSYESASSKTRNQETRVDGILF